MLLMDTITSGWGSVVIQGQHATFAAARRHQLTSHARKHPRQSITGNFAKAQGVTDLDKIPGETQGD
jgi:hypothetical protein